MADEEKVESDVKEEAEPSKKGGMTGWIITAVVVIFCAAGGYGVSGIFAKNAPVEETEEKQMTSVEGVPEKLLTHDLENAKTWTSELEPVVANLDEPGVTRFIRMTVIMELGAEMDETAGRLFLDQKTIYLRDWLQTYLSGLNIDDVKGSSNQARIKVEIRENFNQILFPDSKPLVNRIMLKGYAIQ